MTGCDANMRLIVVGHPKAVYAVLRSGERKKVRIGDVFLLSDVLRFECESFDAELSVCTFSLGYTSDANLANGASDIDCAAAPMTYVEFVGRSQQAEEDRAAQPDVGASAGRGTSAA